MFHWLKHFKTVPTDNFLSFIDRIMSLLPAKKDTQEKHYIHCPVTLTGITRAW
jgi:hypothetical protein